MVDAKPLPIDRCLATADAGEKIELTTSEGEENPGAHLISIYWIQFCWGQFGGDIGYTTDTFKKNTWISEDS